MPITTSYIVDNDRRFREAIGRALLVTNDLRTPFRDISRDFYKSEKAIFQLETRGQYPDLNEKYKKRKMKVLKANSPYPILKLSGALAESMLGPKNKGSINHILNKRVLVIGTSVKNDENVFYPIFHQNGGKKEGRPPIRKFLFIGPEAPRYADSDQMGRPERWFKILNSFVLQKLKQQGFDVGIPEQPPKSFVITGKEGQ